MCLVYRVKTLVSLQVIGSKFKWSYLRNNIYQYLLLIPYSYFSYYDRTQSDSMVLILFSIAFQARLLVYALKMAHIRAVNLR
jgi:hypothetical protein